jgi:hypothetical protein
MPVYSRSRTQIGDKRAWLICSKMIPGTGLGMLPPHRVASRSEVEEVHCTLFHLFAVRPFSGARMRETITSVETLVS